MSLLEKSCYWERNKESGQDDKATGNGSIWEKVNELRFLAWRRPSSIKTMNELSICVSKEQIVMATAKRILVFFQGDINHS